VVSSFVIVLREAFEAALVIGLVFAFLKKIGHARDQATAVWAGTAAAVATSVALGALLFIAGGELEGNAEKLYEGFAMLLAAVVLTGMLFWMRRQAATIGGALRAQVSEAISDGSRLGLAVVAFVAVAREGIETALFLFASVGESGTAGTFAGAFLGLALAVVLGILLYRGSMKMDLGRFFLVTGVLVIVFAAYLLASGLRELGEAGAGEAGEIGGVVAGIAYAVGFGWLYIRATQQANRERRAATAA
jgi:high-affinity iron transporter